MSNEQDLYFGSNLLNPFTKSISLETIRRSDETFFKIENFNQMDPFFMSVVSDVDHWMYISSTGGVTCGRKNADSALFPYYTDDKIHDSIETSGSDTVLIVEKEEKRFLWKPFSTQHADVYVISRNLYKNAIGNKIIFEEINHDLNVSFSYTWKSSDTFGFVKASELINLSESVIKVKVLDGIRNILPYGVDTLMQTTKSTLVDGYKRCELHADTGLGIYTLSSILSDKAEPSESLKATTVWSKGFDNPTYLLSEQQLAVFTKGNSIETEYDVKGRRGAYYVHDTLELSGNEKREWVIVAELNQSAASVESLINSLKVNQMIIQELSADVLKGDNKLRRLVFEADGFQHTANEKAGYRHFSNTLYNIMRGGIYADEYKIDTDDFNEFIEGWNKSVYDMHLNVLKQLPETIEYHELLALVKELNSPDFERLVYEYLPLTYSRRHGDPSRPWNKFNIDLFKDDGSKKLKFEGNWRDIFQNWEALSISYPGYIESIIAKFLNASTADGYNPYRITKEGIDWEVHDPQDPWSNIGYWGDHQIIYLLKLLELSNDYDSSKLKELLHKNVFVYANVPYRIRDFKSLVKDPRNSIDFDDELGRRIDDKTKVVGSDGKLIYQGDETYKVNLMEKLLVTMLSKFSNYVPEGGIWMNTQRPEWNDANNALVGNGLSMVTLGYLHRFLAYMRDLVEGITEQEIEVSIEVLDMFNDTLTVLEENRQLLGQNISNENRFAVVKSLGEIGQTYRNSIYDNGFTGIKKALPTESLKAFIEVSSDHLKDSINKNKREDGLYHSYNLIHFDGDTCSVSNLYEMLEGQVAVLSSKALDSKEAVSVLKALRSSSIYREDQNSYMLYPNRELPKFLEKNIVPAAEVMSSVVLKTEIDAGRTRFIEKDIHGNYHFNGQFRNSDELVEAIERSNDYEVSDIEAVGEIFTRLFNHHAFTGRSGTFYKYEGLGCIYWHMVSKLALITQENFFDAYTTSGMSHETKELMHYYEDIKAGIGLEKSPEDYGAFPTDPYSHTPGFAGVQQPGMTGQVKEDFIARFGELGVKVKSGCLIFDPVLLPKSEFLKDASLWTLPSKGDKTQKTAIQLEPGSLAFTFCAVPVVYKFALERKITVYYNDGTSGEFEATNMLNKSISQRIFMRNHQIDRIEVSVDSSKLK
ncbi:MULTISPECIES: hypothetical protein [unclassified Fusibacter]|uniref:hypothetical protein n=1 Tax=unclassified Fusibacter TaxID=2624464 RepID=UPI001012840B|nr:MULTISPECIES: hypothetical protein [unclassified Fusibacter]MCK8058951.1 hypothetical protein [Fusibacter sp. A2]NPE22027.1 hypothetical protein [Fusibacter sp. A1]RXV61620.1 hypothetical protein DWB64_09290 [Fusibacter sp. A1]